jgi:hypothetical protein
MTKSVALALTLIAAAGICRAEPRWCSVTGIRDGKNLYYPPIAKAARVYGVVLERVIFFSGGEVQASDMISGPAMLSASLSQQLKSWTLETNAQGSQPCVSLVIADFQLVSGVPCENSPVDAKSYPIDVSTPSILRLKSTAGVVWLCDPGGYVSRRSIFRRVGQAIRRILHVPIRAQDAG